MLAGAWIVVGLTSLAAMMAGRRWGAPLEIARWAAAIPVALALVG